MATFTYAPSSQIETRARTNEAYGYAGYGAVDRTYAANGLNQYATVGGATQTYDANGNLTGDGAYTYGYDAENRLISKWSGATQVASLAYDPLGRLWQAGDQTTTRQLLWDGDALALEYDAGGNVLKRYVHGTGADEPLFWYEGAGTTAASRRTLVGDYQGSIVLVTDANGTQLAINTYDEYGNARNTANATATPYGRFGYTGQAWLPELGLYYYKARIYSPALGRFLQTDPVGYQDQINLYAYVGNDPVNGRDPDGKCVEDLCVGEAAVVGWCVAGGCEAAVAATINLVGAVILTVSRPSNPQGDIPASDRQVSQHDNGGPQEPGPKVGVPAPPGNDGVSRPHGSPAHDAAVNREIQRMRDQGYRDIRKNQTQVDAQGNRVGSNRPDVQGTNPRSGQREHVEVDRDPGRAAQHRRDIMRNDPTARCTLLTCPK